MEGLVCLFWNQGMTSWAVWVKEEAETHSLGGHGGLTRHPEYLKWSEVPISFDRSDYPAFVPKPGGILL
jgi:hypothetical protein